MDIIGAIKGNEIWEGSGLFCAYIGRIAKDGSIFTSLGY